MCDVTHDMCDVTRNTCDMTHDMCDFFWYVSVASRRSHV